MFWEILPTFTRKEKEMFLRFVWGRSRLPNPENFDEKFVIMDMKLNNDIVLPVSHTCFFQFELPRYSTKEIMKKKILYASNNCLAIDTDHNVNDNSEYGEGKEEEE